MWRVRTLAERPDLQGAARSIGADVLPEFMHHDAAVNRLWGELFDRFAGFQVAVCDEGDRVVAAGNSVPLFWDGSLEGLPGGVGETIERGVGDLEAGRAPTVASALLATVAPGYQGRGLSGVVLRAMRDVAAGREFAALIAPVRPTLKDRYPLTPMERYARWRREDGLPFDPWIRVHRRLGAGFLRVAPRSMTVTGTVGEWEGWTGMRFPESGPYVVPGALCPVGMDLERDVGTYEEPNVWMRHPIEAEE
jgi:GNAT superfamily N-acetyltransferase